MGASMVKGFNVASVLKKFRCDRCHLRVRRTEIRYDLRLPERKQGSVAMSSYPYLLHWPSRVCEPNEHYKIGQHVHRVHVASVCW